jgi:hypothetical protein
MKIVSFNAFACILLAAFLLPVPSFCQNIGGIGAQLAVDSAGGYYVPVIKGIIPNSPAAKSLKENEYIQKVSDVSCKNKNLEEVVGLIRGETGTAVKITVSDDKPGKNAHDFTLVRASIQLPAGGSAAPPDPVTVFYTGCGQEVKQIKRQGNKIVKTYKSDCGDYFFNFNADTGQYYTRVLYATAKDAANNEMAAKVFNNIDEAAAIPLHSTIRKEESGFMAELDGDIRFKKEGVGTISIKAPPPGDGKKCIAVYIIIYK